MAHRILIVDDDPTLIEMLTFVLTRGGYETAAAADGNRAIEILRTTPIDLVVLDVMLPDTDGYEICRRIRALPGIGQLPILMLSARTQVPHRLTGFESGADDYVPKPADPKEILARVRALLVRAGRAKAAPPVIAFVGVKGGVGATTTSVNVALSLLSAHPRTVLVELGQSGQSGAWQLGLTPRESLLDLTSGDGFRLSAAALQPCIDVHSSGLHYLAGRPHSMGCAAFRPGVLADTLSFLQSQYDAVIVDLDAGALLQSAEVVRQSSALVPVAERDPLGIWHLDALRRWLADAHFEGKVPGFVLVDRATEPSRETASSLASQAGMGVLGLIPPAPLAMYQANVMREPLYVTDPECDASQAYRALGEVLMTQPIEAPSGMRP